MTPDNLIHFDFSPAALIAFAGIVTAFIGGWIRYAVALGKISVTLATLNGAIEKNGKEHEELYRLVNENARQIAELIGAERAHEKRNGV